MDLSKEVASREQTEFKMGHIWIDSIKYLLSYEFFYTRRISQTTRKFPYPELSVHAHFVRKNATWRPDEEHGAEGAQQRAD